MSGLVVEGVSKSFLNLDTNQPLSVLDRISLRVEQGEIVVLFGPNGCGKSTLLRVIASLIPVDEGKVTVGNRSVSDTQIGFVFQDYRASLFPWWSAYENIAFNLRISGIPKKERKNSVAAFLSKVGISLPLDNYPYNLSGGQQQLCAILRELIELPSLLLLDEPFAALDYQNRLNLEQQLLDLLAPTKVPVLMVSHDIEESVYLADRVIVLSPRPAHIVDDVKIALPRPRTPSMRMDVQFFNIRNQILSVAGK